MASIWYNSLSLPCGGEALLIGEQAELNAPQDVITCTKPGEVSGNGGLSILARLPECIPMTEAEFAAVSSIFTLGGLIGALSAGPVSTKYGRKLAMFITSFFFVLGSCFELVAPKITVIFVGRLLSGVGGGASTVIVPIYISEIAPPKQRGLYGFFTQVSINIGILLTQTLGFFLSRGSMWRYILTAGAVIGLLQFYGLFSIRESPAWLNANGRYKEAIQNLEHIRGSKDIEDEIKNWEIPPGRAEEQRLLQDPERAPRRGSAPNVYQQKALPSVGFFGVIRDPQYRPALIAVVGIMVAQQFCGINSIMMYSVSLLRGVLPISSSLLTIGISIMNLITTIACAPLADTIGRKKCLLLSITGMGTMSLCLAISMRLEIKILSAISVLFFVAFFATGLGPVPFMMASELVGQEAVGATQSVALGSNYVATFLVAQFFPIINKALNARLGGSGWVYFIFAALALLSAIFVAWRVPETKGKKNAEEVWGRAARRVD